jgi:hypothetical protein
MASGVPIVRPERDQLENAYRAGLVELASSGPIEVLRAAEALPVDPQAARMACITAAAQIYSGAQGVIQLSAITQLADHLLSWVTEA